MSEKAMVNIVISEKTKLRLSRIGGKLQSLDGRRRSYNEIIEILLDTYERMEGTHER